MPPTIGTVIIDEQAEHQLHSSGQARQRRARFRA
jgi:hypothetical protein